MTDGLLERLADCVERGKVSRASPFPPDLVGRAGAEELCREALDAGVPAAEILTRGLMAGMGRVGDRFGAGLAFVPDILIAARAMKAALVLLKPSFDRGDVEYRGTAILGTVAGDMHDIGKNIVGMVLEGAGWKVVDLGVDAEQAAFLDAVEENPGALVAISALLTTTMVHMEGLITEIRARFPGTQIYVGGAPVTPAFAEKIGATGTFPDPQRFVDHLEGK